MKLNKKAITGVLIAFAGAVGVSVWQPWDNGSSINGADALNNNTQSTVGAGKDTTAIFTGPDKFAQAAAHIAQNPLGTERRPYADPLKKDAGIGRPYADPLKKGQMEEIIEEIVGGEGSSFTQSTEVFAGGESSSITESFTYVGGGYPVFVGGGGGGWIPGTPVTPTTPTAPVPEPSTWAMMIIGMGMVGAAMRRRKEGPETALTPNGP